MDIPREPNTVEIDMALALRRILRELVAEHDNIVLVTEPFFGTGVATAMDSFEGSGDFSKHWGNFRTCGVVPRPGRNPAARIGQRGVELGEGWRKTRIGVPGIHCACILVVLHLDLADLAPRTPQLPHRRLGALTQTVAPSA